jgi:peptide/nickel transport system substrate-binding protein
MTLFHARRLGIKVANSFNAPPDLNVRNAFGDVNSGRPIALFLTVSSTGPCGDNRLAIPAQRHKLGDRQRQAPLCAHRSHRLTLVRSANIDTGPCRLREPSAMLSFDKLADCEVEQSREKTMRSVRTLAVAVLALLAASDVALAQKQGGILRVYHRDSPASASIHEEATYSVNVPFMPVFNNLVIYKQDVAQNSLDSIVPELADSWAWSGDNKTLNFKLHQGVTWHDGKPFTSNDVKCTFDMLMGKSQQKFRKNPRKSWYDQVVDVTTNGDFEVAFNLKRPQPALLALLASGYTPIYPCHVSPGDMRTKPVGTGPFKFVEFKANESIKLTRNTDYWKKGLPHLDGIEFTIIPNRSTAILGFVAGKFDMTFPTEVSIPLLKDVKSQAPNAICVVEPINVSTNIIVNSTAPPFDNLDIRRAMALALDRPAFISILNEGQADIGGTMLPAPGGLWAMPKEMLESIPGYGPDVNANREEARKLMQKAGYGPDRHLEVKVSTRNIAVYTQPAVILIDQLKSIYIDGELDEVETANWFSKVARKDYALGLNLTGNAVDDPDQAFYENYSCNSERNYTNYCNKDIEKLFDQQSQETDVAKRKKLVWEIDKKLQEDVARPIIFHGRLGSCWQPYVKGITIMVNSSYNGYRYEDVWLDK